MRHQAGLTIKTLRSPPATELRLRVRIYACPKPNPVPLSKPFVIERLGSDAGWGYQSKLLGSETPAHRSEPRQARPRRRPSCLRVLQHRARRGVRGGDVARARSQIARCPDPSIKSELRIESARYHGPAFAAVGKRGVVLFPRRA